MTENPLCTKIARSGEPIYASIMRNRSGIDSGCIDYGCRVCAIGDLDDADKQDIADTAFALYESVCRAAGTRAKKDNALRNPEQATEFAFRQLLAADEQDGMLTEDNRASIKRYLNRMRLS